eukprot:2837466-Lingulodinium_polyedra.AAC.1
MEPVVGAPSDFARGPVHFAPVHEGSAGVEDVSRVLVGHLVGVLEVHHGHAGVQVEEGEAGALA